jgi:hypothetical protein
MPLQIRTLFLFSGLILGTHPFGGAQSPAPSASGTQLPSAPPYQGSSASNPAGQRSVPTPTEAGKLQPNYPGYSPAVIRTKPSSALGSAYIPVDSWIYPAALRLYSMGFLDTAYLNMRPWTRQSVIHMLEATRSSVMNSNNEAAQEIFVKLLREVEIEAPPNGADRGTLYGLHSVYTRMTGIGGPVLRDSFHLGQTITNDYGRPYETGFNNITGFSTLNEAGLFSLYVRGEYQHAPSGSGYSNDLATRLSRIDQIVPYAAPNRPQDTIPEGPLAAQNPFRLVEASLSFHLLGHEISGGKNDAWLGPGLGGSMAWTNNAENIYSFRINRVEPLHIPFVSKLLGPVRYDFFYGSLKGHTSPNSPYTHSEMFTFEPTSNFQFGFQRTIIFGGAGHAPVTLHTFLKGFFDINDTTFEEKFSRNDPGARFSTFNFSYRLPFVRKYATLYADAISHDDVTPISAPRRASFRTGLYFPQLPGKLRKMDLRIEASDTDPAVGPSQAGLFTYWETAQRQGYTNKGFIMGDWMGREAKGGQAWLTYQLSGDEWVQLEYLHKKNSSDFIPLGTTQNQFKVSFVKRFGPDVELNSWLQYEGWKAPIYKAGYQQNTTASVQLTWYPKLQRLSR